MVELRPVADLQRLRDDLVARLVARRWYPAPVDREVLRREVAATVERLLPASHVYDVVGGERVLGRVWTNDDRGALGIADVQLDDPALAAEVLERVTGLAGPGQPISVSWLPGQPGLNAVADLPGFETRATNMALPLADLPPDDGRVVLQPMTDVEYAAFMAFTVDDYAADLARSGMDAGDAQASAVEQHAELLPQGLATPDQVLLTARSEGEPVGTLWLGFERVTPFVYDVVVDPALRGRGLGRAIMQQAALWCAARGANQLGLNVFAHNPTARALYDSLGYAVTLDYRILERS
jgi:GNAT superfamily N-acetyltransferase